jgi:hypothetical protein
MIMLARSFDSPLRAVQSTKSGLSKIKEIIVNLLDIAKGGKSVISGDNELSRLSGDFRKKLRWLIQSPPENYTMFMQITPAMAAVMMEHNADSEWRNRPQSEPAVRRYAENMRKGWKFTGDTIVFSKSGRLLNGQHRLQACLRSGCSFPTLVVFGVDDEAFAYMDVGTRRTAAHIFAINGVLNYNMAASIARVLYYYDGSRAWDGVLGGVENDELFEFYSANAPAIQASGSAARAFNDEGLLTPQWAGFAHCICWRHNQKMADEFFGTVATGLGLSSASDIRFKLRKRLLDGSRSEAQRLSPLFAAAYTIQAWNVYRGAPNRSFFKWRGDQSPNAAFPRAL